MSTKPGDEGQKTRLTAQQLEAAVRLLTSETQKRDTSAFTRIGGSVIFGGGTAVLALLLGLVVIWSDWTLGKWLFVIGGVVLVVSFIGVIIQFYIGTVADALSTPEKAHEISIWRLSLGLACLLFPYVAFSLPILLGFVVIWFDRTLGEWLLISGGTILAFWFVWTRIKGMLGKGRGAQGNATAVKKSLEEQTNLQQQLKRAASNEAELSHPGLGGEWAPFIGLAVLAGGIVWLIYSLVATHMPNRLSLVLISVPILIFEIDTTIGAYRLVRYWDQMSDVLKRLEGRLQQVQPGMPDAHAISPKDLLLLAQTEEKQVRRAMKDLPTRRAKMYYISMAHDAGKYLKELPPEGQFAIHEQIDSLQTEPEPPTAKRLAANCDTFVIRSQAHDIRYSVDRVKRLIDVIAIGPAAGQGVSDVS